MRMLDNVIDINYYAVKKARDSNLRHRPVGLGVMGFQDALYELRMPYASEAAVRFADVDGGDLLPRLLGLHRAGPPSAALQQLQGLAVGQGVLPLDTLDLLAGARRLCRGGPLGTPGLGRPAQEDRARRHAQLQLRGHRPHRHHLQHHRRGRLDRAQLRQPVGQVQPVGRVHRHQPATWCAT
jgi:hypothetical protein